MERTNSRHNLGVLRLAICTERHTTVINAYVALANTVIVIRQLIREAWTTYRRDTRPPRRP